MKKLNLDVIRLDGDTQPREKIDQDRIDLYAENMKDGDKFEPVTVHHDGTDYWLSSGFHRYFATKKLGLASIECNVINGTLQEAQIYACGANAKGPLTLTAGDIKKAVTRLLGLEPTWPNRQIARHIGCSATTVGKIRNNTNEPDKLRTVKRGGKTFTVDVSRIGKKPAQEEPDHRFEELADTVTHLEEENKRLRDAVAVGRWDATEIEKEDVQETIAALREQIRQLEIDNAALRDSRDMFQNRNAELMKTVKSLQAKIKKLET